MDAQMNVLLFLICHHLLYLRLMMELWRKVTTRRRKLFASITQHHQQMVQQFIQTSCNPITTLRVLYPPRPTRRIWRKKRCLDWWQDIVLNHFTNEDWLENFRMSKNTFNDLCELVRPHMEPQSPLVYDAVPLCKRVAIAVFKLSSCCENRVVGNVFGVHKATVWKYLHAFCDVMVAHYLKKYIYFPAEAECKEIAARVWKKTKFPQAVGFIDGTHIPILPPAVGYRDFINRKMWPSYILQVVADDHFRFRDISCKIPGSAHDAHVLKESALFKNANSLPLESKKRISYKAIVGEQTINFTKEIPLCLLGDPAYPLLPWLLKGFTGPHLTSEEESFNVYLSSARICVEIAFGRLKARWRMLLKRIDVHYTYAPKIIATCCILHNIVENAKEQFHPQWFAAVERHEEMYPQPRNRPYPVVDNDNLSFNVDNRRAIMLFLSQTQDLRTSFK